VEFELICLPDKLVHIVGFGREDSGILEVDEVIIVEPIFCHHRFVWVSKLYVTVMLLYSGLNRSTSTSYVNLTTLAGYALHPWSPQPQGVVDWTEVRDLPRQQANILLRQPYVIRTYGR
jgi:hypothetical protein